MANDVDLYEFNCTLGSMDEEAMEWLEEQGALKHAFVVEVETAPDKIKKALLNAGYDEDDSVMIVVQ